MVEADKSGALKQEVAANGDVFGDPQEEGGAIGTEDPRNVGLGEVNSQEAKDFKSRPLEKGYRSSPEVGNMGFGGGRAPTIKLDSVLRNFDGSQSVDEWLTKFMLVARYSRWEDEETRVAMLVLRLEGSALLVFEQMPQHLQFNFEAIVAKLKAAFLPSTAEAHRELMGRRYITGESPERLWSDLVRLFKLSTGQNYIDEYTLFTTIKPFFLNAIPKQAALQVRLASPTDLEDFMEKTRFVLAELAPTGVLGAVGAARRFGKPSRKPGCFRCGSTDHRVAECSKPVTCFKCKKGGHISKDCKEQTAVIGAVAQVTQPYPLIAVTLGSSDQRRSKQVVAAVDTMACVSLSEDRVAPSLGVNGTDIIMQNREIQYDDESVIDDTDLEDSDSMVWKVDGTGISYEVGQKVLYRDPGILEKDKEQWKEAVIREVLGRGAYNISLGMGNKTRKVNSEWLTESNVIADNASQLITNATSNVIADNESQLITNAPDPPSEATQQGRSRSRPITNGE